MDDRSFANQLCAWVDPGAVVYAATMYEKSPQLAKARNEIRFPRAVPGDAKDTGLDTLIDKFLRGFELPGEYLELLAASNTQISKETWDWLAQLRFTGQVMYSDFPPDAGEDTVLLLSDAMGTTPLLSGPIDFLIRYAAKFVPLWKHTNQRGVFFEPSAHSQLSVFIEYTVAVALGNEALVRSAEPRGNATVQYGDGTIGFSMVSEPPFAKAQAVRDLVDDFFHKLSQRWLEQTGSAAIPSPGYDFTRSLPANRSKPTREDGFVEIEEAAAVQTWRNIARWRNECSPYAILRSQNKSPTLLVDTYYGRVFDFPLEENEGIYGITRAMPDAPWSQDANVFLRTPYRKVPAYVVKSRAELDSVWKRARIMGDGSGLLFRGQPREYLLQRSANAREILYGDREAKEPSLLASSERSRQPLETVLPAWCLLIRSFLRWVWGNQLSMPELAEARGIIEEDAKRILNTLDLHLYAVSMAQHYGLPTMGLDVTDDFDTALFFALHQVERLPQSRMMRYRRKSTGDPPGVLYVFAPDERFHLNHELSRPRTAGQGRPERQRAKFLITGWGYHRNAVARHLGLAFYLDPGGDFGNLPSAQTLFPARGEDLFGNFLENALEQGYLPQELRKYVEQLYWVMGD